MIPALLGFKAAAMLQFLVSTSALFSHAYSQQFYAVRVIPVVIALAVPNHSYHCRYWFALGKIRALHHAHRSTFVVYIPRLVTLLLGPSVYPSPFTVLGQKNYSF